MSNTPVINTEIIIPKIIKIKKCPKSPLKSILLFSLNDKVFN